jgi:hypothetical protein
MLWQGVNMYIKIVKEQQGWNYQALTEKVCPRNLCRSISWETAALLLSAVAYIF